MSFFYSLFKILYLTRGRKNSKRAEDTQNNDIYYRSNMSCIKCHRVENHRFPGVGPSISREVSQRVQCTDCHAQAPHGNETLNKAEEKIGIMHPVYFWYDDVSRGPVSMQAADLKAGHGNKKNMTFTFNSVMV